MKRDLRRPSVSNRPLADKYLEPKDLMKLPYEEALTALADYDGPVRTFLEGLISVCSHPTIRSRLSNTKGLTSEEKKVFEDAVFPPFVIENWKKKAMEIMNVIYKLNGLKQQWDLSPSKTK